MMYIAIIFMIAILAVIYKNANVFEVNTREEQSEFYRGCLASMTDRELVTELDNYRTIRKYQPQYVFMGDHDVFKEMLQVEANVRLLPKKNRAREVRKIKLLSHTVTTEF